MYEVLTPVQINRSEQNRFTNIRLMPANILNLNHAMDAYI